MTQLNMFTNPTSSIAMQYAEEEFDVDLTMQLETRISDPAPDPGEISRTLAFPETICSPSKSTFFM
jgi:hypothetical protein